MKTKPNKKGKKYNCPYCTYRDYRINLIEHVEDEHEDLIPKGYSPSRVVYNAINKKDHGTCMICKKETEWDESKQRYNTLCGNPRCKSEYVKIVRSRMVKKYGTYNLLNDPEFQKKMLENRSISGKYKFQDGGSIGYVGSYEKKFLEFMDQFLHIKSYDIISPGPTIPYIYGGKEHTWITDFLYEPYNLVFDIKDGGDNPNTRDMKSYREKQIAKEKAIAEQGEYNYIRLTDNKFEQLISIFMELKENVEDKPLIRINEAYIYESSSNKTLYHLSQDNLDGKTLSPRIPSNFLIKNGYEDGKTKRVCFAKSIDGSLRGMSQNLKGIKLYVHIPEKEYNIYNPTPKEVPDCKITGEVWIKEPVKLKCIGQIEIIKDKGEDGIPYKYGNNIAELFDWDWKWIEKFDEAYIEESTKSSLEKDYKPKGKKNLSSFKKVHLTEEVINKYKKEYPFLRHVRCKDTKEYICDGYIWFDNNELVAIVASCEYTDDKTKWIVSLEITKDYKGYGLSKQILDYSTKSMKCKYLSVNKNNKLAKKVYDDYGFKVYRESEKMYYMTIDKDINESVIDEYDPPYSSYEIKRNYGFETYKELSKDPAHNYRMNTGIELIHQEPSKDELERIWKNWNLMSDTQKKNSDKKSKELFGLSNEEHYHQLLSIYTEETTEYLSKLTAFHLEPIIGKKIPHAGGWDEELYSKDIESAIINDIKDNYRLKGSTKVRAVVFTTGKNLKPIKLGIITIPDKNNLSDWEWEEKEIISDDDYDYLKLNPLDESYLEESKVIDKCQYKECPKCGSKNIGCFIQGEPIFKCKDCDEYLGTVPFK